MKLPQIAPIITTFIVTGQLVTTGLPANACSRVLWNDNTNAVVVGRNMDWFTPLPVDLYILPRSMKRSGLTGENTLEWTSKYGSVTTAGSDGINEKGLALQALWLAESDYGKFDQSKPGLGVTLWPQFYLDKFATVKEAVAYTQKNPFQVASSEFQGKKLTIHLSLADADGDSVVIEYLDGKVKIYHSREHTVMTNSPTYDKQLEGLKQYKGFGGERDLPGSTEAADRFVRGAYYLKSLPEPENTREAIAGIMSVMRNVAQPFSKGDATTPNRSQTRWRTVADLTNKVYYFESSKSPFLVWIDLKSLDFSADKDIRRVDLMNHPDRLGNVTEQAETSEFYDVLPPTL